jgi:tetratricopeptide (TPR) repeat protein
LALNRGAWEQADALCRSLPITHHQFPDALYMRGFIALNQGRFYEAAGFIGAIVALRPEFGEAWGHLAAAFRGIGAGGSALRACHHQALTEPHNVQAWFGFGMQALQLGIGPLAASVLEHAVQLAPDQIGILAKLGSAHALAGHNARAAEILSAALAVQPGIVEAQANLGHVKIAMREFKAGIAPTATALALDPAHVMAWVNLSVILERLGHYEAAIAPVDHALAISPQDRNALVAYAAIDKAMGRFEAAAERLEQACSMDENYRAGRVNLGLIQLLLGDFDNGFSHFEERFGLSGFELPNLDIPIWRGEDLTNRSILIVHEQGLGDSLQFSRYADDLWRMGAKVFVFVQPTLVHLFRQSFENLIIVSDGDPIPQTDFFCPLMSLPHRLKLQREAITAKAHLQAMPTLVSAWQMELGPKTKPRIGIAWSGNPAYADDHTRSLRLSDLATLLNIDSVDFHIVQRDIGPNDQVSLGTFTKLHRHRLSDMSETAALMSCMDLIISSDTSTAHLAAGLGLKTWIMLCAVPDWRWFLHCDTSPWYPSVRLFRQSRLGQWTHVVALVRSALEGEFQCQQP